MASQDAGRDGGHGAAWVLFAGVVLFAAGAFNVLDGLVAVSKASYMQGQPMFSTMGTWGWVVFAIGIVGLIVGAGVTFRQQWARWAGIVVCLVDALVQLAFLKTFPFWSAMIIGLDFLVIYALVVYGGRSGVWE
jgi:hypothetical protein